MATETDKAITTTKTHYEYQPLMKVGGVAGLQGLASAMKSRIADVLPKHVTPERMLKAMMVAASKTPKIFDCTQESICKSLMDASSLGLDCSGTLGSGYLVPFKKSAKVNNQWVSRLECQFIPGYRGLIDLARRGGQIATIEAHAVYAQDFFLLEYGTDSKLVHRPYLQADRREEFLAFYAVATLRDGTRQIEVMTLADVNKIRDAVFAKNRQEQPSGPWVDHYAEMARKTVVRRICKYLPLSPELEKALQLDDEADQQRQVIAVESIATGSGSKADELASRLSLDDQQDEPAPADNAGDATVAEGQDDENPQPAPVDTSDAE
jgi:recombination protein RecT